MIFVKYGFLLLSTGILAENNDDDQSQTVTGVKDEVKDKLKCYLCHSVSWGKPLDKTDKCVTPVKDDPDSKKNTQKKVCDKKCFSYTDTRIVVTNETEKVMKQMIVRGCSEDFPGITKDLKKPDQEKNVIKQFEDGNITEACVGGTGTITLQDKTVIESNINLCGTVCETSYCNTDFPEASSGLSTGALIGIICGSLVGLGLIIGLVVFLVKKKGYKQPPEQNMEEMY